jgi:hypothetical protein
VYFKDLAGPPVATTTDARVEPPRCGILKRWPIRIWLRLRRRLARTMALTDVLWRRAMADSVSPRRTRWTA